MLFPKIINIPEEFSDFISRLYSNDCLNSQAVFTLTFQVTDDCCLNCVYCYQGHKGKHKLSFNTAKQMIDQILTRDNKVINYIDSYKIPGVVIEFIGGEPFLEIELIDQITDYFINKMIELRHPWATKYKISISSNGILYFEPKVQEYIKKNNENLSLSISIDGNKKLHDACRVFPDGSGSYDKALSAALHYSHNYNKWIGSKMTISPFNIDYLYDAVLEMINNGYNQINLNCVYEKGWELNHATTLYYQLKKIADYLLNNDLWDKVYLSIFYINDGSKNLSNDNWCGGNGRMLALNWKGKYYPCLRYMEDSISNQPEYYIGDIYQGIGQDNLTINRLKDLSEITVISQSPQECLDCEISGGCSWCTAYNYQETGNVNKRVTYICDMHYATVLASLYYLNSILKKINSNKRFKFNGDMEKALKIISQDEYNIIKEAMTNENRNDNNF